MFSDSLWTGSEQSITGLAPLVSEFLLSNKKLHTDSSWPPCCSWSYTFVTVAYYWTRQCPMSHLGKRNTSGN
jgi:hypothetical protein